MEKITILHIYKNSMPVMKGGSIRGYNIAKFQKAEGINPIIITSPYQPSYGKNLEMIDGIQHYRTCFRNDHIFKIKKIRTFFSIWELKNKIFQVANIEKPHLIHSHSSFDCGFAAWYSSRILKIPFIHEVRGFREESRVALREILENSFKYQALKLQDKWIMDRADRLISISQGIYNDMVKRGVEKNKIFIVPNGVDTKIFAPKEKDNMILRKIGIKESDKVLGFVGSLRRLEGLNLLCFAMNEIIKNHPNTKMLIVGNGSDKAYLERLIKELGINKSVFLIGEVAYKEIPRYYSIIDIVVIPRLNEKVNHLVTPLKLLEPLSMGKALVISDVGGLIEALPNKNTRLVFRSENVNDLSRVLNLLIRNDGIRKQLGDEGREWVINSRDWNIVIKMYKKIYDELI
jgi:glycosyltransferase involved in cell wall biosynthesis